MRIASEVHAAGQAQAERDGTAFVTRFVWHGGEPLLLPKEYIEAVLEMQREHFSELRGDCRNVVQTNLYSVDFELIRYLIKENFTFGVSYDGVSGARVTANGRSTEHRVLANVAKLDSLGGRYAFIVVIAGHNIDRLMEIYEWARCGSHKLRLLPLFEGPAERPMIGLNVSETQLVEALFALFLHWFEQGAVLDVQPFHDYLTTIVMHRLSLERAPFGQAAGLDPVILIDPDGYLYKPNRADDPRFAIGSLDCESWSTIRASDAYTRSVQHETLAVTAACQQCEYFGACDGYPLTAVPMPEMRTECGTYKAVIHKIDCWLEASGVTESDLQLLLDAQLTVAA